MARNTYEAWIPEEWDSDVIKRVQQGSAVEAVSRREPMSTDTKRVPRSAGVGVESIAKGGTYGEDASVNDDVVLTARKFGRAIRIAEEDLNDSLVDILDQKRVDWATSYGKFVDNAALAVTAAENGTTVPFTSVYNDLATNLSANRVQTGTGGVTYDNLSSTLGLVEAGDYFSEDSMVVVAHPAFRQTLRGIKDTQENPIFVQGLAGTPDTLFGLPIRWSLGAKTSATATDSPSGSPLCFFLNRDYLILGVRSGPESIVSTEVGTLTDEAILKMRSRRGFALGKAEAASVLEDNS